MTEPFDALFVKLHVAYYDDICIACNTDAGEVMFTRAIAFCGRAKSGGFVPDVKLADLTRKPTRARRIADSLCAPVGDNEGPFVRVEGGYQIRNWHIWQNRLDALEKRRTSDRDRQRVHRGGRRDPKPAPAPEALHPTIAIFADKLHAVTHFRAVRFDKLTDAQTAQLVDLIEQHGDERLVKVAVDTARPTPPQMVNALLGTWAALPPPGARLAAVETPKCADCHQTEAGHPWPGCDEFTHPETRTA